MRPRSVGRAVGLVVLCVLAGSLVVASAAYGSFGLSSFEFSANEVPPAGSEPGDAGCSRCAGWVTPVVADDDPEIQYDDRSDR